MIKTKKSSPTDNSEEKKFFQEFTSEEKQERRTSIPIKFENIPQGFTTYAEYEVHWKKTWNPKMDAVLQITKSCAEWKQVDAQSRAKLAKLPQDWLTLLAEGSKCSCQIQTSWSKETQLCPILFNVLENGVMVMKSITKWHISLGPTTATPEWQKDAKFLAELKLSLFEGIFGPSLVCSNCTFFTDEEGKKHESAISFGYVLKEYINNSRYPKVTKNNLSIVMAHFKEALSDVKEHMSKIPELVGGNTYMEYFVRIATCNPEGCVSVAREAFVAIWGDDLLAEIRKRCQGICDLKEDQLAAALGSADDLATMLMALGPDFEDGQDSEDPLLGLDFCKKVQSCFVEEVGKVVKLKDTLLHKMKNRKTDKKTMHMTAESKLTILRTFLRLSSRNENSLPPELMDFLVDVLLTKVKKFKEATDRRDRRKYLIRLIAFAREAPQELALSVAKYLLSKKNDLLLPEPIESNFKRGGCFSSNYTLQDWHGAPVFVKVINLGELEKSSMTSECASFFLELLFLFRREFEEYLGATRAEDHFHCGLGLHIIEGKLDKRSGKKEGSKLCIAIPLEQNMVPISELTVKEMLEVMLQLSKNVQLYHQLGWVHNDLHPMNFIVKRRVNSQEIEAKLCDHGLTHPVTDKAMGCFCPLFNQHVGKPRGDLSNVTTFGWTFILHKK